MDLAFGRCFFGSKIIRFQVACRLVDASKNPYNLRTTSKVVLSFAAHLVVFFHLRILNVCMAARHLVQATSRCCLAALINALHGSMLSF